jgi:hypothetical protein
MNNGWIKIHRKITEWEWYDDANAFRLFFHLLIMANHEAKQWHGITIARGKHISSYAILGKELRLTTKSIRVALNKLKGTGEVAHEGHSNYGLFTINKYDDYQDKGSQDGSPRAVQGQSKGNKQELKELKELKERGEYKNLPDFPLIRISEKEYDKLITDFGEGKTKEYLNKLYLYIGSTGKKYKSHYLTVLAWMGKDAVLPKSLKPKVKLL